MRYRQRSGKYQEPRTARTIPLKGSGLDEGVWFRCWNCGFRCKVGRDANGPERSHSGATTEAYTIPNNVPSQDIWVNPALAVTPVLDGDMEFYEVALKSMADGTGEPPVLTYSSVVRAGCPFCGSKNWRGDY